MKNDIAETLSSHNLKVTGTRKAVVDLIEKAKKPVDAQFLVENLQKKGDIDRATVFRILNVLTGHGILRKLEFGEGKARYELNKTDHHHFICTSCGLVEDISDCNISELEEEISKKKKIHIERHSLEFFGLCDNCFKKSQHIAS
jgi:Fur family ferric uptake transcriptional regulator